MDRQRNPLALGIPPGREGVPALRADGSRARKRGLEALAPGKGRSRPPRKRESGGIAKSQATARPRTFEWRARKRSSLLRPGRKSPKALQLRLGGVGSFPLRFGPSTLDPGSSTLRFRRSEG